MRNRRASFVTCALAAVTLACSGCGGSGAASTAVTFRIGAAGAASFDSPNPFVATSDYSLAAFRYIYPHLVQYRQDLSFEGDFATHWSASGGGKDWTFDLTPNAKWSDGQPLTSKDVAWTLNTIVKYQTGATASFANDVAHVANATAPSPTTVVVHFDSPVGAALARLGAIPILPEHVWGKYATRNGLGLKQFANPTPVVSGGPFVLDSYKHNDVALFDRNPDFYGPRPHIARWGLEQFSSSDAMVAALEAGQIDMALALPPTALAALRRNSSLVITTRPGYTWWDIGFNSDSASHPELSNPKLRLALQYATNTPQLINVLFSGLGQPGVSVIPPATGSWFNSTLAPVPYNPAVARQMLDQLGYKVGANGIRIADGHPMKYSLLYVNGYDRFFQLMQTDFRAVGVQLVPQNVDPAGYTPTVMANHSKNFDITSDYWDPDPDPDNILGSLTCNQLQSYTETSYCNREYDRLYEEQGRLINPQQRRAVVWQMQKILDRDRPYNVLFYTDAVEAYRNVWTGLQPTGVGSYNKLSNASLIDVRPATP